MTASFPTLKYPIVQAPMAGGPSTPELAAAVSDCGGLGFLATGYRTIEQVDHDLAAVRQRTRRPFGVNLFSLTATAVDDDALEAYARALEPEATRWGVPLGRPHYDDDGFADKLELVCEVPPPIVSFTFGCPSAAIERLHERGVAVWVTITDPSEAVEAAERGADAVIVQGVEAGGHRGSFDDLSGTDGLSLLPLLRLVAAEVSIPLVATGGLADGPGIAAALVAGARAAQIGTAFMLCPEAATSAAHRSALTAPSNTAITRAFTGRRARGVRNRFMREHDAHAPAAYPHLHHLTAPIRAAARSVGDPDAINLWAGEAHPLAEARPAAELVRQWSTDARLALERTRAETPETDWPSGLDPLLEPDFARSALIIIDTQVDFVTGGACPIAGTSERLPNIARLLAAYRAARLPIVHVVRLYDGADVDLPRRAAIAQGAQIVRPGTPGSQLVPALREPHLPALDPAMLLRGGRQTLGDDEVVMWKPRWSAFYRTDLQRYLDDRGVNTVVFAGCNYPNCPRASIVDASERDYRTVLATDATSQLNPMHLTEARAIGVICATTEALLAFLQA